MAGGKVIKAKTRMTVSSWNWLAEVKCEGRIRRRGSWWVFETRPVYPLYDEAWQRFFSAQKKDPVLAEAIKCQLKGWITEWIDVSNS